MDSYPETEFHRLDESDESHEHSIPMIHILLSQAWCSVFSFSGLFYLGRSDWMEHPPHENTILYAWNMADMILGGILTFLFGFLWIFQALRLDSYLSPREVWTHIYFTTLSTGILGCISLPISLGCLSLSSSSLVSIFSLCHIIPIGFEFLCMVLYLCYVWKWIREKESRHPVLFIRQEIPLYELSIR